MDTINSIGHAQIGEWLHQNCKLAPTVEHIAAYASDAEQSLMDGNGAAFELPAYASISGRPETCVIGDAGIDRAQA